MSNVSEVEFTGLLMIPHDNQAAWTSGESIADAYV